MKRSEFDFKIIQINNICTKELIFTKKPKMYIKRSVSLKWLKKIEYSFLYFLKV